MLILQIGIFFAYSLFQHYRLYQFLFTQDPQEEIISTKVQPLSFIQFFMLFQ